MTFLISEAFFNIEFNSSTNGSIDFDISNGTKPPYYIFMLLQIYIFQKPLSSLKFKIYLSVFICCKRLICIGLFVIVFCGYCCLLYNDASTSSIAQKYKQNAYR